MTSLKSSRSLSECLPGQPGGESQNSFLPKKSDKERYSRNLFCISAFSSSAPYLDRCCAVQVPARRSSRTILLDAVIRSTGKGRERHARLAK
jgi:hypothetical protein